MVPKEEWPVHSVCDVSTFTLLPQNVSDFRSRDPPRWRPKHTPIFVNQCIYDSFYYPSVLILIASQPPMELSFPISTDFHRHRLSVSLHRFELVCSTTVKFRSTSIRSQTPLSLLTLYENQTPPLCFFKLLPKPVA
ncbi:unnamed protein product [Vicia faba]|uniref:Uncharacterized protein n=1 Tax=Vicia faba TaxID=3906 RepID=A0AAV1AUU5_VICFA|nr:unnamed protein product [Vicia faba]